MTDGPTPARLVADADVLAADLLVGGPSREALDLARAHDWIDLVASDPLLADAEAVITDCADADLAADWRERIGELRESVSHPAGDHPALASAYNGDAPHLLTFDEDLRSVAAGVALNAHVDVSVREPRAFVALFDPESIYEVVVGGEYPGPDRDPRA
ncbi:MAG: hypothetical protein ABEJ94_05055 [Halorientalis sp.]